MEELVRERNGNIEYSLHDSRIKKIGFDRNTLIFEVDIVYKYENEDTHGYEAKIIFKELDSEECNVIIFDRILTDGKFSGRHISFKNFIKQYRDQEFEILKEFYSYYYTTYNGWLWQD